MAITEENQPIGFWVFIRDTESAAYAAKMSGLPLFLTGLGLLGLVLAEIIAQDQHNPRVYSLLLAASLFVGAGLAIRMRVFDIVPIATTLFLIACAIRIVVAALLIMEAPGGHTAYVLASAVDLMWALPSILCALMMISGLRGWNYLRRHKPVI